MSLKVSIHVKIDKSVTLLTITRELGRVQLEKLLLEQLGPGFLIEVRNALCKPFEASLKSIKNESYYM